MSVLKKVAGVLLVSAPIIILLGWWGGWDHLLGTMFELACVGVIVIAGAGSIVAGIYLLEG